MGGILGFRDSDFPANSVHSASLDVADPAAANEGPLAIVNESCHCARVVSSSQGGPTSFAQKLVPQSTTACSIISEPSVLAHQLVLKGWD